MLFSSSYWLNMMQSGLRSTLWLIAWQYQCSIIAHYNNWLLHWMVITDSEINQINHVVQLYTIHIISRAKCYAEIWQQWWVALHPELMPFHYLQQIRTADHNCFAWVFHLHKHTAAKRSSTWIRAISSLLLHTELNIFSK